MCAIVRIALSPSLLEEGKGVLTEERLALCGELEVAKNGGSVRLGAVCKSNGSLPRSRHRAGSAAFDGAMYMLVAGVHFCGELHMPRAE